MARNETVVVVERFDYASVANAGVRLDPPSQMGPDEVCGSGSREIHPASTRPHYRFHWEARSQQPI
jgi:hypothetical protein